MANLLVDERAEIGLLTPMSNDTTRIRHPETTKDNRTPAMSPTGADADPRLPFDAPGADSIYDPPMACTYGGARGLLGVLAAGALLGTLLPPSTAHADAVAVVNALRERGCRGQTAAGTALQRNAELDAVARELPRRDLSEALERTGYPAASSVSFHTRGSVDDATVRKVLTDGHCPQVNDGRFAEIGVFQRGNEIWIVLASRKVEEPLPANTAETAQRVLELVNAARREARSCGNARFEAAMPLRLSEPLGEAALLHARDMAARQALTHEGGDGSLVTERIARTGYVLQGSGENVAAGQRSADAVVAAWLASPGHCANIMEPRFTEMGIALALAAEGSNPLVYWAQVFATPR